MITWLQGATSKHHRTIFSFLLVIIVASFVFYGFAGRNGLSRVGAYMYMGVDLNDPQVRQRHRDAMVFSMLTSRRPEDMGLERRVAELSLADSLNVPVPTDAEIRRIARDLTAAPDAKDPGESLQRFIESAGRQIDAPELETRARFERYIVDTWRISRTRAALTGPGHATASQLKRLLERERALWTVDAATFSPAGFKTDVKDDEAKAKAAFESSKESYRIPARLKATLVRVRSTEADTSKVSDEDLVTAAYNYAEQLKLEPGKIKEEALKRRPELEKLVRQERAALTLSGLVSDELADRFPADASKASDPAFAAWLKSRNAVLTSVDEFEEGAPPQGPALAAVPAEALRMIAGLSAQEWRTDVYRVTEGALFLYVNARTESRLPSFEEAKAKALAAWRDAERERLVAAEVSRLSKALLDDQTAGKAFPESAKALGLKPSNPAPFAAFAAPEAVAGVSQDTAQVVEAAGVGKVAGPVRTRSGEYVFLRASKREVPPADPKKDDATALMRNIGERNAYLTGMGLLQDLTPPPEVSQQPR
ncbi:MAG: hypothetical protein ACO3ND_00965 [Opitutales bacterium]